VIRRATVGAAVLAVIALSACIIAEPVSEIQALPQFRPVIVRSSVVPSPSAVLASFPTKLVIPVELVDPRLKFEWRFYVDYNPQTGTGPVSFGESTAVGADQRLRLLEVQTGSAAIDPTRCHVLEFVVAQQFEGKGDLGGRNAHTPIDPPGGDSVTWLLSPDGDLRGCPVPDAGLTPPDAGRDAEGGS